MVFFLAVSRAPPNGHYRGEKVFDVRNYSALWPKKTLLRLPKSLDRSVKSTIYTPFGIFFSPSSDVHWSLKKIYYGIMTPSNNKNGSFLSTSITVPLPAEDGQGSYSWPLIKKNSLNSPTNSV